MSCPRCFHPDEGGPTLFMAKRLWLIAQSQPPAPPRTATIITLAPHPQSLCPLEALFMTYLIGYKEDTVSDKDRERARTSLGTLWDALRSEDFKAARAAWDEFCRSFFLPEDRARLAGLARPKVDRKAALPKVISWSSIDTPSTKLVNKSSSPCQPSRSSLSVASIPSTSTAMRKSNPNSGLQTVTAPSATPFDVEERSRHPARWMGAAGYLIITPVDISFEISEGIAEGVDEDVEVELFGNIADVDGVFPLDPSKAGNAGNDNDYLEIHFKSPKKSYGIEFEDVGGLKHMDWAAAAITRHFRRVPRRRTSEPSHARRKPSTA